MLSLLLGLQGALAQATGLAPAPRVDESGDSRQQDGLRSCEPGGRPQGGCERGRESEDTEGEVTEREAKVMAGRSSEDNVTFHSVAGRHGRHANRPGKHGRMKGCGSADIFLQEQNCEKAGTMKGRATAGVTFSVCMASGKRWSWKKLPP